MSESIGSLLVAALPAVTFAGTTADAGAKAIVLNSLFPETSVTTYAYSLISTLDCSCLRETSRVSFCPAALSRNFCNSFAVRTG